MKPYLKIPIRECGEPLVPIPAEKFSLLSPHPYEALGADYGGRSPYSLRQGVLDALLQAQTRLEIDRPGWKIQIFDAYRPVEVQQFMVDHTFNTVLRERGLQREKLSTEEIEGILQEVYTIWAIPSDNPATPPPHSTGSAVDITLVDATGRAIEMGGEIDEMGERSRPDYYLDANSPVEALYHENRSFLDKLMKEAGFNRHKGEWWHFSLGDQMWAWSLDRPFAIYGGVHFLDRSLMVAPIDRESR
ncbi:M15 family metallopeptidase [Pannus brasiliensis CCIBt3594]|uniref:D-alanyl-D-alanine dipeptidase n=1 Tax=Pannus brasiliensis CCIBt3594 TaxID=1427578 RepID=A0AAW9QXX3_9CHRO